MENSCHFKFYTLGKLKDILSHYAGISSEFDVWNSPNHWANQDTSLRFIQNIIIPYVERTRAAKGLGSKHPALAIFNVFRGQNVDKIHEILEENRIMVVLVPSTCTDQLQPLDLSFNKPAKDLPLFYMHFACVRVLNIN